MPQNNNLTEIQMITFCGPDYHRYQREHMVDIGNPKTWLEVLTCATLCKRAIKIERTETGSFT